MLKMKFGKTIIIALTLAGAKVLQLPKQENTMKARQMLYKDGKPLLIAHRAGQFEAPENTLIAIETAFKNGARGVEIDLDFTMDGVPVLMHDNEIDRTTNGHGELHKITYKDLKDLNAAANHSYIIQNNIKLEHSHEKIPTLYEAVEKCLKLGMIIDLDIKSNPTKVVSVLKEVQKMFPNSVDHIFLTSFYPQYLYVIRKECPEFITGVIWRPKYLSLDITGKPRYENQMKMIVMSFADVIMDFFVHHLAGSFLGTSIAVMKKDVLSEHYIKHWKEQNHELIVWTVNNPTQKEYFFKHLNVPIITDSILNSKECSEQTS